MFFLQVDTTERLFNTSPDTVYGVLVGIMGLAIIALWVMLLRKIKGHEDDLRDLILKNVEAMNLIGNNLDKLRDANEDDMRSLREALERLRFDIVSKLDTLLPKSTK